MRTLLFFCLSLFLLACTEDPTEGFEPIDLLDKDIPVTVLAPPGAEVKKGDLGIVMKDVTVRGGDNYSLQIFASAAATTDVGTIKQTQLENVKSNPSFDGLIEEFPSGFIYRTSIDSLSNFSFRRVKVVGDQEIIFQPGLGGSYSEADVRLMYTATE